MGRSIVYCDKCGQLLKEEDFLQGKAFTADNRSYCAGCRPPGAPAPPKASKISSSRIPKQPSGSTSRMPKQPSQRLPIVTPPAAPASAPARQKSSKGLALGLGGGLVAVVAILAMVAGGGKTTRRADEPTTVVTVKGPPPENPPSETRRREDAARAAFANAFEIQTTRPVDLAAHWRAFEAAAAVSQGTSYAGNADREFAKLRRRFEAERAALETQLQPTMTQEQFRQVLERWEAELKRFDLPDWTRPIQQRIGELKADFDRRLVMMRDAATEARRRGDEPESRRIRDRVASWGIRGYAEQVDEALAAVVPVKPDAPVEPTGATKAVEAYRARWKETVSRDYPEAVKAMEKLAAESKDDAVRKESAEDLENLRLAAAMVQEGVSQLQKLAKGQRIALTYWDGSGGLARVEDAVLKIDAHRVEIKSGEGSVVVPFGEVAVATLADLVKSRPARAAVAACLLEGDAEGAQRFRGEPFPSINEKYGEAGKEARQRRTGDDREQAARRLFYEAERGYFDAGEMAGAIAAYKSLLAEHAGTSFVRRNRGAIASRAESGLKDFFFTPGDLTVASSFKLGRHGKIDAWASQQDLELAKMKENFVEFEFSAGTEGEVRCWVLAGGCCQEVLTFYVQGTDLLGPNPENPKEKMPLEPGSGSGVQVKSTYSGFKKTHAQHTGPKNPERFEWLQVCAFKYPTAGPKRIRILSNQKGFGVAAAAAISSRPGPPRDSDFKELEKWRAETPGATVAQGGIQTGSILREVWRGINGSELPRLLDHPAFKEDRPSEQGFLTQFEAPTDWADDYGTRLRGYVHPPVTGAYVFWLASDDNGELWLSTDEDPKNRRKIAFVRDHCSPRSFDKYPADQQSAPVELKRGKRYYVEVVQKEGVGGDHLCVKWKLPTGTEELPIPGSRLSPFVPPKK
jgi:hypothetical protein